jgi:hypothetical protein
MQAMDQQMDISRIAHSPLLFPHFNSGVENFAMVRDNADDPSDIRIEAPVSSGFKDKCHIRWWHFILEIVLFDLNSAVYHFDICQS